MSQLGMSELVRLSVSQLTSKIAQQLASLGGVAVEGEVSKVSRAPSGHVYFDLKDQASKVACKLWKSRAAAALTFDLKEGAQVVVHGSLDVYQPHGAYSLIVARMELAGVGELLARLERLKAQLRQQGWFDRKRAVPSMPRRIGLVTSRESAAFADFLRTRTLRWPGYPVLLASSAVQGAGAAEQIASAIARLERQDVDVIVLARGGGSLEDLWAFNELPVAQAIWNCPVPVVCGVGHETDFTLADMVADLRAHTPTDAAQRVIPERARYEEALTRAGAHLLEAIDHRFERSRERLDRAGRASVLCGTQWIFQARAQTLASLAARAQSAAGHTIERRLARVFQSKARLAPHSPVRALEAVGGRLDRAAGVLRVLGDKRLSGAREQLELAGARLEAYSHRRVLARGYAIVRDGKGGIVRNAAVLTPGADVAAEFSSGAARLTVREIQA